MLHYEDHITRNYTVYTGGDITTLAWQVEKIQYSLSRYEAESN